MPASDMASAAGATTDSTRQAEETVRRRLPAWWQAVVVCLTALAVVLACAWVATDVFDRTAHVEDEVAFLFQAQVFASGDLLGDVPPQPNSFWVPFVLQHEGDWFGKYPPGWPAILALGSALGAHWLVNPLAAGLVVVLTWLVGRRLYGTHTLVPLVAALLLASSPFLLLQGGSVMSHVTSQALALLTLLGFLQVWSAAAPAVGGLQRAAWGVVLAALGCGAALGYLFLARSLTAVGIGLPLALWALARLVQQRGRNANEWLRWLLVLAGFLPGVVALLLWNQLTTGHLTTSAYELWWPYDRIGFGEGISRDGTYTFTEGLENLEANLRQLSQWLFGWPWRLSFVPALLASIVALGSALRAGVQCRKRRRAQAQRDTVGAGGRNDHTAPLPTAQSSGMAALRHAWQADLLLLATAVSLMLVHLLYWTDGQMYGPRYYFEASAALALLSARGLQQLTRGVQRVLQLPTTPRRTAAFAAAVPFVVALLVGGLMVQGARTFTADRTAQFRDWYTINRAGVRAVEAAGLQQALVIVPLEAWSDYAPFFLAFAPDFERNIIYVADRGPQENRAVVRAFPERTPYRYVDGRVLPWTIWSP